MLVTDAWEPQVNGVVRTMKRVIAESEAMGHEWEVVHPGDNFFTMPLPSYPEIKLALFARHRIEERFHEFEPDAIHIATEGTLGMAGRAMCLKLTTPLRLRPITPVSLNMYPPVGLSPRRWAIHSCAGSTNTQAA